jgi:hypothetical protein
LAFSLYRTCLCFGRGIPKLVALAEFEGDSEDEVRRAVADIRTKTASSGMDLLTEGPRLPRKSYRYWLIRRGKFQPAAQKRQRQAHRSLY